MTVARTRNDIQPTRTDLAKLFDRLPPHSTESEMCLIGSLILAGTENIHLIGEVMHIIKSPADFYWPKHAVIYEALVKYYDQHQSIDSIQLAEVLRSHKQLDGIGGVDYLIELAESVPTAVNAPHYARIVRDKAKLRHLIDAAGRILHDAHESPMPADELMDHAEKEIFEIASRNEAGEATTLSELVQHAFQQIQDRRDNATTLTGVSTGFGQLDDLLNGLQKGELIILAARPSMGKTACALNIAEYISVTNKHPVAVFSLEMSKQQLAERLLSARSGVDSQRIRKNLLGDEELRRLTDTVSELYDAPMFIDDTPGISVLELRAKARRLASRHDIKAIVIDYLQLMSYPGAESRVQEVSAISRGVKALARELNVPVICLSQLNRNPEGRESKRPMLSDLRESGSIEQDADVVMMLHREEYYHSDPNWKVENPDMIGVSELIIAKQRNGPTGTVYLHFDGKTTSFHQAAPPGLRDPGAM